MTDCSVPYMHLSSVLVDLAIQSKHQFQAGDVLRDCSERAADAGLEPAEFYKSAGLDSPEPAPARCAV
jgi:hypothetical protein